MTRAEIESQIRIARKIERRYLIGSIAHHVLGPINRQDDIFVAHRETDHYWIGNWITGFGFINVLFPKETSRELTEEEKKKYQKFTFQIGKQRPYKLEL